MQLMMSSRNTHASLIRRTVHSSQTTWRIQHPVNGQILTPVDRILREGQYTVDAFPSERFGGRGSPQGQKHAFLILSSSQLVSLSHLTSLKTSTPMTWPKNAIVFDIY